MQIENRIYLKSAPRRWQRAVLTLSFFLPSFALSSAAHATDMPVDRVILSSSGLAQFERQTDVSGNVTLQFPVRRDQVDDILQSLVVFDPKGHIGSVTLAGRQPLDQIFKGLPFSHAQLDNVVALLNAYQGADVTVKGPEGTLTGKIIRVLPEKTVLENNKTVVRYRLSLMTAEGLQQAVLENVQSLKFDDQNVQNEINRALVAVRNNGTLDRRTLNVHLLGAGKRYVTLSYVLQAPVWKTAYRLVVPPTGKDKGFLQGWAIIENMTANDWKDVDLSLVSGDPVTFKQALYPAYYVHRPEVPVKVFGMTLPRVDKGTVGNAWQMQAAKKSYEMRAPSARFAMDGMAIGGVAASPMGMNALAAPEASMQATGLRQIAGEAHAALSHEAATQVLFHFPDKLSLQAGQSMMLPFVSRNVPMKRISLYQPETNARHPLASVEITNNGGSSLPPGILTLYAENPLLKGIDFVGDAQLSTLNKDEKRIVSYALDTKTTIDRVQKTTSTEGAMTASQGVIRTAVVYRAETDYTIKAPKDAPRTVVIEKSRMDGDYKLVEPDPKTVEVTAQNYRITVPVKAGATKTLRVVLENRVWESYGINSMSDDQLMAYASGNNGLSRATRKAFVEIAGLRRALDDINQKIDLVSSRRNEIFQDQARIRENLRSLTGKSAIRQKYLDELDAQETRINKLAQEKQDLVQQRQAKRAELQGKIAALSF